MNRQHGNVLFIILIAVGLFAALCYAVTSSTRNTGPSISKDKARVNAAAILQFASSIRNAVTRVKLSNGCTDYTLDFSNTVYKLNSGSIPPGNPTAPADKTCNIFDLNGGGIIPIVPNPDSLDLTNASISNPGAYVLGHVAVQVAQMNGVGTDGPAGTESANDVYIVINYLNRATCIALNDLLGVTNPSGDPPLLGYSGTIYPYGNGSTSIPGSTGIWTNAVTNGQPAFCRSGAAYYQLLFSIIER